LINRKGESVQHKNLDDRTGQNVMMRNITDLNGRLKRWFKKMVDGMDRRNDLNRIAYDTVLDDVWFVGWKSSEQGRVA
jgi:hypothetical protein